MIVLSLKSLVSGVALILIILSALVLFIGWVQSSSNARFSCQSFWTEIKCAPLKQELINLVRDRDTAQRLVTSAKLKNPGQPEHWYLEKVIYDLKRGR